MIDYDMDFEYGVSMGRMADMQTDFCPQDTNPLEVRNSITPKQRKAILKRDNNHSQMRHYSEEKGWYKNENCPYDGKPCTKLEVHHIVPQHLGGEDEPNNLLTISACEHRGVCPDRRIK